MLKNLLLIITGTFACLLFNGCTPLHITKTTALNEAQPFGNAKNITVFEEGKNVERPYQILGKVTVYRSGTKITKGATTERICEQAATLGADGIIGLHRNYGGAMYSGIAVKWLAPGEASKPKDRPFVIALTPIITNVKMKGDPVKFAEGLQKLLVYHIETKGYYLQSQIVAECVGGFETANKMNDENLARLGGPDTDYLMEIVVVDAKKRSNTGSFIVGGVLFGVGGLFMGSTNATTIVRVTVFQKSNRQIVFQKETAGEADVSWMESDNTKQALSALDAVNKALGEFKVVYDVIR